jgi:hypothetical protein
MLLITYRDDGLAAENPQGFGGGGLGLGGATVTLKGQAGGANADPANGTGSTGGPAATVDRRRIAGS